MAPPSPVPPSNDEAFKKQEFPRGQINAQWPPPQQQQLIEDTPPPPPPPPPAAPTASSDLSSESVRLLAEEESNKEQVNSFCNLQYLAFSVFFKYLTLQ
jgi:hypothetical protein